MLLFFLIITITLSVQCICVYVRVSVCVLQAYILKGLVEDSVNVCRNDLKIIFKRTKNNVRNDLRNAYSYAASQLSVLTRGPFGYQVQPSRRMTIETGFIFPTARLAFRYSYGGSYETRVSRTGGKTKLRNDADRQRQTTIGKNQDIFVLLKIRFQTKNKSYDGQDALTADQ